MMVVLWDRRFPQARHGAADEIFLEAMYDSVQICG
jgi:hypothetical protein